MESLRFIHAADLHLDSPFKGMEGEVPDKLFEKMKESTFRSFAKIVDIAIIEKVDFVLLAGDLYDTESRSLRSQIFLRKEMKRLEEHNIYVYIIHGNHDHLGGNWAEIEFPENVIVFEKDYVEYKPFYRKGKLLAYIYGFSYTQQTILENMTSQYEKEAESPFHIGMLHGSLEGNSDHSRYAPFLLQELLEKRFDYWALGHIHKRSILHEQPPVIYPGNIQGRHRKETGEKGCYLVTLQSGSSSSYKFVPTSDVIWEEAYVSIDGLHFVDELLERCNQVMQQIRHNEKGTLLVLSFTGYGELSDYLEDPKQFEEIIHILQSKENDENFIYIIKCYNHTFSHIAMEAVKQENHFIGELLHEVEIFNQTEAVIRPLWQPAAAKNIEEFSEEEKIEIMQEAKRLILQELLAEREDTR